MAEIRNGMVVVRSSGEEEDAPSYHNLRVGTSTTYNGGGLLRRTRSGGVGWSSFPPPSPSSPSPSAFEHHHHVDPAEERHFLDSCYLCNRPLGTNQDIFMYRGNIPFCSEECRQDQIDTEEMKNRKWSNLAAKAMLSAATARKKETVASVNRATGTVVA